MKKIDKLILSSFLGPFIMTFLVVVFILLTNHMLRHFDDIIGKDLGWDVVGQLLFYFAIFMTPAALPLSILLSALITFGNLGEHFELTAIKSSGVSLVRVLQPIFIFVIFLTGFAFYINNNVVPKAALEAYSLLYDIKQKKPALDLREGVFYNELPDISIKVNAKLPDGITIKDIIVYDHRKDIGNDEVIIADSGRMTTILGEQYVRFELFNGYNYKEGALTEKEMTGLSNSTAESLTRSKFNKYEVVMDLSSFALPHTAKEAFETHRIMRNLRELDEDIDSLKKKKVNQESNHFLSKASYFSYFDKNSVAMPAYLLKFRRQRDSVNRYKNTPEFNSSTENGPSGIATPGSRNQFKPERSMEPPVMFQGPISPKSIFDSAFHARIDSFDILPPTFTIIRSATNMARQVKSQLMSNNENVDHYAGEKTTFEIQWHKIIANSFMCVVMFLIGAPLGAIIKRGGLGIPFLVSILFFIIYYVLNMQGEKLARQNILSPMIGVWIGAVILLLIGFFFLRQARIDARLFDADAHRIFIDRIRKEFAVRLISLSRLWQ